MISSMLIAFMIAGLGHTEPLWLLATILIDMVVVRWYCDIFFDVKRKKEKKNG